MLSHGYFCTLDLKEQLLLEADLSISSKLLHGTSFAHRWIDLRTGSHRHRGSDSYCLSTAQGTRHAAKHPFNGQNLKNSSTHSATSRETRIHRSELQQFSSHIFSSIICRSCKAFYHNRRNKVITYRPTAFWKIMNCMLWWSHCSRLDARRAPVTGVLGSGLLRLSI